MELKPYQQKVLNDLAEFISYIDKFGRLDLAYKEFWNSKGVFLKDALHPDGLPPYKSVIPGVPHVAMKVPTAGGKTFIAANAIRTIFDSFAPGKEKVVVWLVPSITILDQTVKNLSDRSHPYRQKIDTHFNGRVEVYEKDALLQGAGFNSTTVKEQLSILVLSYDSFRTKSKEGRKVYQENENLTSFFSPEEEVSLVNAIQKLNPVIIVDESHNAESELSVEMLNTLNPSFVLDLTATPRDNSNIISFVDSFALKKEHMVKLPVLVYNHNEINEVISNAVVMRNNLEQTAKFLEEKGGEYIRPIVLFQAQPKNSEDKETFEKTKERLIAKGIPAEQIAIKTASINEIKNIDLMSKDCEIRYIITINALKEGWDCPFAYILASLANKQSKVDVEQILGRILRQPYTKNHEDSLLNMSYVFTASQNFNETLQSIIEGLNKSGFSRKDYRVKQEVIQIEPNAATLKQPLFAVNEPQVNYTIVEEIDTKPIDVSTSSTFVIGNETVSVNTIIETARKEENSFEEKVKAGEEDIAWGYTDELAKATNMNPVKEHFKGEYLKINLPQFFISQNESSIFESSDSKDLLLSSEMLLDDDFELRKQNTEIDFDAISLDIYVIDIEKTGQGEDDYTPKRFKLDQKRSQAFIEYINSLPEEKQISTLTDLVVNTMGRMEQFSDQDLKTYVRRVIEDMDAGVRTEIKNNTQIYARKIKKHIENLAEKRMEDVFSKWVDTERVFLKNFYALPNHITPTSTNDSVTKSLYVAEQAMNNFELEFITEVASLSNVKLWHKIIERKGFCLNGFLNHYPDFLIVTGSGKKMLIETKGDHLDNSDSVKKLKLGKLWANKAGGEYRYFMVFKENPIPGAYLVQDLIKVIREL